MPEKQSLLIGKRREILNNKYELVHIVQVKNILNME